MSFEDEEKKKQAKHLVKTMGILMAIGFMLFAVFLKQIGPLIGFNDATCASSIIKYAFFAVGIMDLIAFTFVIK